MKYNKLLILSKEYHDRCIKVAKDSNFMLATYQLIGFNDNIKASDKINDKLKDIVGHISDVKYENNEHDRFFKVQVLFTFDNYEEAIIAKERIASYPGKIFSDIGLSVEVVENEI